MHQHRRSLAVLAVVACMIAGASAAFTTTTKIGTCDLTQAQTQGNAAAGCNLSQLQAALTLAPNEAKYVEFTGVSSNYLKTTFKGWSGTVTATVTAANTRIFHMWGACKDLTSASNCANYFKNGGNSISNAQCSPNCFLNYVYTSAKNPLDQNAPVSNPFTATVNVPFAGSTLNDIATGTWTTSNAPSQFVVFSASLSAVSITSTLTLEEVDTKQNVSPLAPGALDPPPPPPPPKGASLNTVGVISMLLPLLLAAVAYLF